MDQQVERNPQSLLRALMLLGLTAFLIKLLATGEIRSYINPRFAWLLVLGAVGLMLMAAGQLYDGLRLRETAGDRPLWTGPHLLFLAVLCAAFFNKPHIFGADLAAQQGINLTNSIAGVEDKPTTSAEPVTPAPAASTPPLTATTPPDAGGTTAPATVPPTPAPAADLNGPPVPVDVQAQSPGFTIAPPQLVLSDADKPNLQGGTVVVKEESWFTWLAELYDKPARFMDKRIQIEGFVFTPPGTGPGQFALVRLIVFCHVAHANPSGLLVALPPGQSVPAQNAWVRAEGVIQPVIYQGKTTPRIRVDRLTSIPQPTDPYIWP